MDSRDETKTINNRELQVPVPKKRRNFWKWFFVLGVLLILLFVGYWFINKNFTFEKSAVKTLSSEQVMALFPANIPIEKDASDLKIFATTTPEGIIKPVVQFTSKNNIIDNYNLYKNYCSDNGWQISENQNAARKIVCKKSGSVLSITLITLFTASNSISKATSSINSFNPFNSTTGIVIDLEK